VAATATALGGLPGSVAAQSGDGFVALFDGTLGGWTVEGTTLGNFSIVDGALHVEGSAGWLKSARQYADFELLVEFRFLTDAGDSGIFVRAQPDGVFGRGWPNRSYQLQMLNPSVDSRFPPLGAVFRHGMPAGETQFDPAVARRTFTGIAEWQTLLLTVRGTELTAELNGVPLTRAANIGNSPGHIGIQSETSALEFRKVEIREL
jgi:hypothetical protein